MSRKTFLLVPGAWHNGWCWQRVVHRLEQAGHDVLAPDLEGCSDATPSSTKIMLESWVGSLVGIIDAQAEPVVLVGHSRGGIVISAVAERIPQHVSTLVYVSGFLLSRGESVLRILREDGDSPLLRFATLSADRRQWQLDEERARPMFYGECSETDADLAIARLGAEPAAPMMTPLRISEDRFGLVPRAYIECLRDATVTLDLQRRMHGRLPCRRVLALDTGHAPFLSAPDELSARLMEAAG